MVCCSDLLVSLALSLEIFSAAKYLSNTRVYDQNKVD